MAERAYTTTRPGPRELGALPTDSYPEGAPQSGGGERPDPLIGQTLPGGHKLLDLLGAGGMGKVYRAEQTALGRTVAVKFVHPELIHDETVQARFLTEAKAASQLNHPNSVGVIDFGLFRGAPYLVMEYLWGEDLASMIASEAPFEPERTAHILGQVLDALEEAHQLGIVHRDLKPENIIVQRLRSNAEIAKVLDFGLAKIQQRRTDFRTTAPGLVCGTPQFMAPELVRGEAVDGRADLYACGVILFEMLTGVLPFDASTLGEIVAMQLNDQPPDPRFLVPELEEPIVGVVLRALAKPVTERFQSAAEFASTLRSVFLGEPDQQGRHSGQRARCPKCRAIVRLGQRFCGHCGGSLTPAPPQAAYPVLAPHGEPSRGAPSPSAPPSRPPASSRSKSSLPPASLAGRAGLVGRSAELEGLGLALQAAQKGPIARRICGPGGSGKSTLLASFEQAAEAEGATVIRVRPDGWRARVRLTALRRAVAEAVGADAAADPSAWADAPADAQTGQRRLFGRATVHEAELFKRWSDGPPAKWPGSAHRSELAAAMRWAAEQAVERSGGRPVVLTIDELENIDGASIAAFGSLVAEPPDIPLLVVGAHDADFKVAWPRVREIEVGGLAPDLCMELLARLGVDLEARLPEADPATAVGLRPILVDQLHWLLRDHAGQTPDRLADMVAMRLENLPVHRRRFLQLLAVHGLLPIHLDLSCVGVTAIDPEAELAALRHAGWIDGNEDDPVRLHQLIRDIVLGTIPHEARRQLHEQAYEAARHADSGLPIEVRTYHAVHGELAFEALVLLEKLATRRALVGDLDGAALTLRRGVDFARREISRGTLDDPIAATGWFASRLGDVLTLQGQPLQAEGVVREALDALDPVSALRPRLLASLAFANQARGNTDAAHGQLDEAMKLATRLGRTSVVLACAELRQSWALG